MKALFPMMLGVTLLLLLTEIAAGRHRGIYRREDWLVIGLPALLNPLVSAPLAGFMVGSVAAFLFPGHAGALADIPLLPAYLGILLLAEFCFYWVHRLSHQGMKKGSRLRWLWKTHRTHHAGKYMNVLVTLRINPLWHFLVPTVWVTGFAVYLGQGTAALLVGVTIYGWNLITHSHFRWDDAVRANPVAGPVFRLLEHIIVSPGVHHTHHGYGRDGATYRNFAVTFAFLDYLFGTLHIPDGRPAHYGLPGSEPHWSEEVFHPLINLDRRTATEAAEPG
ncbi:sterol desaturase family protein [Novosphingobium sp.]|uniref:sterol desaturase family protein n=1 Tax=Novosphingobium sp. TaxID=1874826 RepID=UPI00261277B3|nr:sterol desaturase family protein [Novosphingobium sp.]